MPISPHSEPESENLVLSDEKLPVLIETREVNPYAFEEVIERERAYQPLPPEPFYKNRAFIAALGLLIGVGMTKYLSEPKVITKEIRVPVEKAAAPNSSLIAFRDLKSVDEFDPWDPLNGGFPVPPLEAQARFLESMAPVDSVSEIPRPLPGQFNATGPIEPMDPGMILPDVGARPLPKLPTGELPAGGVVKPLSNQNGGKESSPQSNVSEKLVVLSVTSQNSESAANSASAQSTSLAGVNRSFQHMSEEGALEAVGLLVILPNASFDPFRKQLESLGAVSGENTYVGSASNHQSTLQAPFAARLAKLREKRKELLIDFLEDAQPVKLIDEAIDSQSRAVSALRLPFKLEGMTVVRILFR